MFSKQFMSLRRSSGFALTFLFLVACFCAGSRAQTAPTAIASFAIEVNHQSASGTLRGVGSIANIATDSYGDVLVVDDTKGALYEFPAGNGAYKTLVSPGGLAGSSSTSTIVTPGIAIDSSNNLFIEGGTCVLMYPFDSATSQWIGLDALTAKNPSSAACGTVSPSFYNFGAGVQTWGIGIGNTSNPSLLVGTSQSGASGNGIASIAVTGAWTAPVADVVTQVISGLHAPAISIAEDSAGNIYFVEQGQGALPGAYEIPAGQTGLTSDSGLKRIDPNLPQVTGVTADSAGNIYISDLQNGVFLLPKGFSSSSAAILVTPVYAQGSVGVTGNNGFLFVPTAQSPVTQKPWNNIADVAEVTFNSAAFGAQAVGASKPESVSFSFNNASVTPGTIEVLEAGTINPDFAVVTGNSADCATGTAYSVQSNCSVTVSFAPNKAGAVSATLAMLDANGNLLASIPLGGIGTSAAVQFLNAPQSTIGSGFVTPSQIAVDAAGNLFVADSGLTSVKMYPAGSASGTTGVSVGKNLTAPTGVAVDGAGNVFIADGGSIYEVPRTASGLNSNGQITLDMLLLGSHVRLAADSLGNLFVLDIDNQKVYELENFSAGWNTGLPGVLSPQVVTLSGAAVSLPTAIATDSYDNLYVVNGGDIYQITPTGVQTKVLSGLADVTGLTVDPSGSVYVAMTGGTIRVPNESGVLKIADKTLVASGVTSPASVALDSLGNVYVADGSALNVNMTSASASIDFGTLTADPYPLPPPAGSSTSQSATMLNYGNAPLLVTGYGNAPDFSETADTCSGNSIAINSTCSVTITFSAGIGDGGSLSGEVLVQGNVANSPVGVNGTGVAPTLAGTATVIAVATNGTIEGVPVSVSVVPSPANSQPLTGNVTLTIIPGSNVPLTNPAPVLSITLPVIDGAVQFNPAGLPIGTYTFTARYAGDATYIYEHSIDSSGSGGVSVATPVPVTITQPTTALVLTPPGFPPIPLESYTLPCTAGSGSSCTTSFDYGQPAANSSAYLILGGDCDSCGGQGVYDGSSDDWKYKYPVSVAPAAAGFPMVGLAVYNKATPPVQVGFNYGTVNYEMANGHSLCGDGAASASIVNVADTGDATISLTCAKISTVNNTIPNIMTYNSFTPVYTGTYNNLVDNNPNYIQVKGSTVAVWALRNPMVRISSNPAALTVASGSSVSSTLTLSSVLGYGYAGRNSTQNNYSLPLDLQCQGLPAYMTCSFSYPTPNALDPNSISNPAGLECASSTATAPAYCAVDIGPDPGTVKGYAANHGSSSTTPCDASDGCLGPGSVTLTIKSNVSPGVSASNSGGKSSLALAALFGMGLLGFAFRRRASQWGGLLMVVCLLLCGGALAGITACSTKTLGVTSSAAVTPPGSYWVTITAKETGTLLVTPKNQATVTVYGNGNAMSLPFTVNLTVGK